MPIPLPPINLFSRLFAEQGGLTVIPDTTEIPGRASLTSGFPVETQLPLTQGGIAPNRLDFNGALHMLSAFAFWQQSGGMFTYSAKLNYAPNCLVVHNSALWWCVKENGPESPNRVQTPGTDEAYWLDLLSALAVMHGKDVGGVPVGTVITYYGASAPEGYFACDGTPFSRTAYPVLYSVINSTFLPDLRGYFIRGYDTRNTVDPSGSSRSIGSKQEDAIRNITGSIIDSNTNYGEESFGETQQPTTSVTGVFTAHWKAQWATVDAHHLPATSMLGGFTFNASNVVPTAPENRPKNVCLLYCIKHD